MYIIFSDVGVALKDKDWIDDKRMINLDVQTAQTCRLQIERDIAFFASNKIIDYSLLIGYAAYDDGGGRLQDSTQKRRFYEVTNHIIHR